MSDNREAELRQHLAEMDAAHELVNKLRADSEQLLIRFDRVRYSLRALINDMRDSEG